MKLFNLCVFITLISAQSFLERGKRREKRIWNRKPRKGPNGPSADAKEDPVTMERALAPGPELIVATNDAVVKADVAESDMSESIDEAEVTFADEGFTSRVIEEPEEIATENDLPMTSVGERQFNGGELAEENRKFRPNGNKNSKNSNSKKPQNSKKNASKKNVKKKKPKNEDPTTTTATTTTTGTTTTTATTTTTTTTTSPPVVDDDATTTATTTSTSATTTTETTTTETTTTATTSTTTTSTKSTTTSATTSSTTTVTTLYPPTLDTTLADTTTDAPPNVYAPDGEPVKNPYGPNKPNNPYSNDDPTTTATTSTTETTTTATTSTKTTLTTTTEDTNIPSNPYADNNNGGNSGGNNNGGNNNGGNNNGNNYGGNSSGNGGGNNNGNDQNQNLPTAAEVEQANAAANQQASNSAFNAEIQNAAANQQAEAFNAANNADVNPQDGIADTQFHFEMSCWNCHGRNYLECAANGKMEKCRHPQDGCYLEVRKRGTKFEQVVMGCRPGGVCEQQKGSNFVGNRPMNHQCRPSGKYGLPSVCRQCCYLPNCTGDSKENFWKPQTASEWNSEFTPVEPTQVPDDNEDNDTTGQKPNKNPYGPNNPNNPYSNPEPTTAAPPSDNDAYIK